MISLCCVPELVICTGKHISQILTKGNSYLCNISVIFHLIPTRSNYDLPVDSVECLEGGLDTLYAVHLAHLSTDQRVATLLAGWVVDTE